MRKVMMLVLAMCLVLTSTCSAMAATKVAFGDEQITVDSFNGVPAYYKNGNHDSDGTYSCAAYVKRYYKAVYGVSVSNLLTGRTPAAAEKGYSFGRVYSGSVKPGDIGYQENTSGSGHWFIIKTVNKNSMTIIEQNWKYKGTATVDRVVTFGSTKNLKVFRLYKDGKDANGGAGSANSNKNPYTNSEGKYYCGLYAIMANSKYCLNVQYASKISDQAKCVIDPFNGEPNEIYEITQYGNFYRISPKHAPNLALNAQYGRDAKAGQQLSLHTWRDGDDASLWSIETSGAGVRFRSKANPNLIIDVNQGWKSSVGNRINLWIQNDSDAQVFTLVKQGSSNNSSQASASTSNKNSSSSKDYSGRWAIKANNNYCLNVQYASKISDQAKCVIDGYNGEKNEIYNFTKYGNYYRISPVHAPNLALNAQYGRDAKAGQQLSLHTWREGDDASLWSIETSGTGVRFRSKANPNLIIDVNQGWKSSVGNRINLWTQNNSEAQVFYLQRA